MTHLYIKVGREATLERRIRVRVLQSPKLRLIWPRWEIDMPFLQLNLRMGMKGKMRKTLLGMLWS